MLQKLKKYSNQTVSQLFNKKKNLFKLQRDSPYKYKLLFCNFVFSNIKYEHPTNSYRQDR